MRAARLFAVLLVACAVEVRAQAPRTTLAGVVRDINRKPVEGALVSIAAQAANASTDSAGRYSFYRLHPGAVRVKVRRIGWETLDTNVVLREGRATRLDVTIVEMPLEVAMRRLGVLDSIAQGYGGAIDSVAAGYIKPDPARAFSDGGFGRKLFVDAVGGRSRDSNTVMSPISAALALSIVRIGARGATAASFDDLLGATSRNAHPITTAGPATISALNSRTDVVLEIANAVWVDSSMMLVPAFRRELDRWRARVSTLSLKSDASMKAINHWTDSVTHGKISSILSAPLPDTTRLFVENAVYFKGKWLRPFEKSATQPGPFTLLNGQTITVPRMSQGDVMAYRRLPNAQLVRVPYRTGKVAMYIILPDSGTSLDEITAEA
jgi:hypothetical protein